MNESQYKLLNNELTLYVKKSPLAVRLFIYFLTLISIVFPFIPIAINILDDGKIKAGPIMIGLFLIVIAIYFVRMSLWNTFGSEKITFGSRNLEYIADYKWFTDGAQQIENYSEIYFSVIELQQKKRSTGMLVFSTEKGVIQCVTKLPLTEIQEILDKLISQEFVSLIDRDNNDRFQ